MNTTHFQYCQKIFLVDESSKRVLVARRAGEADYDGTYSLIGGKMEHSDADIIDGISREKREEIGADAVVDVLATFSFNATFKKKDGNYMILPHYYAKYLGGEISINEEYSDFKWVPLAELDSFDPLIDNVPEIGRYLSRLVEISVEGDYRRLT